MKTEHPILFGTPMVRAVAITKNKNQTRRAQKLDEINQDPDLYQYKGTLQNDQLTHVFARYWKGQWVETIHVKCPFGKTGDWLWVRESFLAYGKWINTGAKTKTGFPKKKFIDLTLANNFDYKYVASLAENIAYSGYRTAEEKWNKRNSIHMPKAAARIWLQVEEMGVERLQDISKEDAIAEGILPLAASSAQLATHGQLYFDYSKPKQLFNEGLPPFWSFNSLWCSIYGSESWEQNPWLWVVKYKVLSTTGKPAEL